MSAALLGSAGPDPRVAGQAATSARSSAWADAAVVAAVPLLVVAGVVVGSPLIGVTAPLVAVLVVVERRRRRRWRADLARADALPAEIDHLIQRLRAGASLSMACRSLGRHLGPLQAIADGLRRGAGLVDATRSIGPDADPSLRLVATTLRLLATNGGPAVPALRRLRHTLIGRSHRRRRAQAQAASALSSAALLVLAPVLFALILAGTEPALARFYLYQPVGAACATASILLSAAGWWWIHRRVGRVRSDDR